MDFMLKRGAHFAYIMGGNDTIRPFWIKRQCAFWQPLQEECRNRPRNKGMVKHRAACGCCSMWIAIRFGKALCER